MAMTKKLWGGRFRKSVHPAFERFSSSLRVDHRLATYDLEATAVHCKMLERAGIIRGKISRRIQKGLEALQKNLSDHEGVFQTHRYEDIHSWIEAELGKKLGPDAGRIHAGRSRNDQVNQAMRMYCRDAIGKIRTSIRAIQQAAIRCARRYPSLVVPGMTHMKKAQPILFAHQLLGYVETLERSKEQLESILGRTDICTLGSGALAGSNLKLDRRWVQKKLGFKTLSHNSWDAVGSRDFVAELIFAIALYGTKLSRISEDLILAQLDEVGWIALPEELCTGSSMMPQKKNPDFLELARGSAAILIGNVSSILTLLKGLPGSYNRDLQWDKTPLFMSVEIIEDVSRLFELLFKGLKLNLERIAQSMGDDQLCATDLAEYLVEQGLTFREAHRRVGELVRYCVEKGLALKAAPASITKKSLGCEKSRIVKLLDTQRSVWRKRGVGSTHPAQVEKQLRLWARRFRKGN